MIGSEQESPTSWAENKSPETQGVKKIIASWVGLKGSRSLEGPQTFAGFQGYEGTAFPADRKAFWLLRSEKTNSPACLGRSKKNVRHMRCQKNVARYARPRKNRPLGETKTNRPSAWAKNFALCVSLKQNRPLRGVKKVAHSARIKIAWRASLKQNLPIGEAKAKLASYWG